MGFERVGEAHLPGEKATGIVRRRKLSIEHRRVR
jgi:hypothetical protein